MSDNYIDHLDEIIQKGFSLIDNICNDFTHGNNYYDSYHESLFVMIKSEFGSLKTVYDLVKTKKYKDCFIMLRSTFETMLFFWLVVEGKKYIEDKLYIMKSDIKDKKEARDATIEMWRKGIEDKDPNYKNIISIKEKDDDKFIATVELEGNYERNDKTHTGEFIPQYWFVLTGRYDPYVNFVSKLSSIKNANVFDDEAMKEHIKLQNELYKKYFRIGSIIENLILNEFVSEKQSDYIKVHYNFLSGYTHPTKERFRFVTSNIIGPNVKVPDEIVSEQILLYICRFQYHFIKILVKKFQKYNPKALTGPYEKFIGDADKATAYFWFIDNEPTKYDKEVSERKKIAAKNMGKNPQDIIIYYENPLERLQSLKHYLI